VGRRFFSGARSFNDLCAAPRYDIANISCDLFRVALAFESLAGDQAASVGPQRPVLPNRTGSETEIEFPICGPEFLEIVSICYPRDRNRAIGIASLIGYGIAERLLQRS
jgi:hypothetical protein